jgi:hypothetical protein
MKRRHLDNRNIERRLFGEHDLERNPDAVIYSAFDALCFDPAFDEMFPDLHG